VPSAYYLYKLKRLPEGRRFGSEDQLQIRLRGLNNRENVHTTVELVKENFREGVDQFAVEHDFLVKLKYPGRVSDVQFDEYVSPYRFPIYVDRSNQDEAPILIVQTKGKVAADFVRRMTLQSSFLALERQLDFQSLRPQIEVITGGWFGQMRAANISSAGMFGSHVDKSDEFIRAERIGTLRQLLCPIMHNDSTYSVSIMSNGGVVLFDSFDTPEDALDLVLHIKRSLLDSCWAM
jgi:hypothetical protein